MRFDQSTIGLVVSNRRVSAFSRFALTLKFKKNLWGSWEDLEKPNNYNLQIKIVLISADSTKLKDVFLP